MSHRKWTRRLFLTASAMAATGCATRKSQFRTFTDAEAATLAAITNLIIPEDEDPGAAWAGVVKYIDRQLGRVFAVHRASYQQLIAKADAAAGGRFWEAPPAKQTEVLTNLEKTDKPAFDLVVAHTMQGFYGNPRHGGNREYVGWKVVGVSASPVRGRDPYVWPVGTGGARL